MTENLPIKKQKSLSSVYELQWYNNEKHDVLQECIFFDNIGSLLKYINNDMKVPMIYRTLYDIVQCNRKKPPKSLQRIVIQKHPKILKHNITEALKRDGHISLPYDIRDLKCLDYKNRGRHINKIK